MELAEVFTEVLVLTASGIELVQTKLVCTELVIRQPEELKVFNSLRLSVVLLLAVRCWDSLKS